MSSTKKTRNLAQVKFFVSVLVIYTTLISFQISGTAGKYKNTSDYYSYFLGIASLVFLLKVFFLGYKSLLAAYKDSKNLQLLGNILLISSSIWLINIANNSLIYTSYPKNFFGLITLSNLTFLLLTILNKAQNITKTVFSGIFYLLIVYGIYSIQSIAVSTFFLQLTSFMVIGFELALLYQVLNWEFADSSKLKFK